MIQGSSLEAEIRGDGDRINAVLAAAGYKLLRRWSERLLRALRLDAALRQALVPARHPVFGEK
jgi:hypothetical protein